MGKNGGPLRFHCGTQIHKLRVNAFEGTNNDHSVIFYNKILCRKLENSLMISVDANYRCVPRIDDAYQLLTIMAQKSEKFIPFIWVLMPKKDEEAYKNILTFIKERIMRNLRPQNCVCDYEQGLHNAVKIVFPTCNIIGCNFHYVYNLNKKARKLNMRKSIPLLTKVKVEIYIKKLCNLPLLSSHLIVRAYNSIKEEIERNPDIAVLFNRFLKYIEKTWTHNPSIISVFKQPIRTNNHIERYHRTLNECMGRHPKINKFLFNLIKLIKLYIIEMNSCAVSKRSVNAKRYKNWLTIAEGTFVDDKFENSLNFAIYKNEDFMNRIAKIMREIDFQETPITFKRNVIRNFGSSGIVFIRK
ncbi:uncharacterized protein [Prorops nasuta]|uniref:uncharacterized protein n=1 Tax=Prorops nasuta TaxID=863751 RepID=UPI0034CD41A7